MKYTEYIGKIKILYEKICQKESDTISTLTDRGTEIDEISQEVYDYTEIYPELSEILSPSLDYYTYSRNPLTIEMIEKVFFVAVCEMVKQDYNRGMLITFRQVTGESDINTNRYYDLLQRVANRNNLVIKKKNGRRLFEHTFILETGIPQNLTKYVIKMFRIYWRYFKEIEYSERKEIIHSYLLGNELMDEYILDDRDALLFEEYKEYVKDFPEKSIRVFDKLDLIFAELDSYTDILDNVDAIFDDVSTKLGFNIGTVLRDSDLKKIYSDYLRLIPIRKFCSIINNLPACEVIILPDGRQMAAKNLTDRNIFCGEYMVRGCKYSVIIDSVLSLEDMITMQCDRVVEIATNYFFYSSRSEFYAEYNGKEISPRRVVYNHQERYIWMMHLAPASTAYIDGNYVNSSERYKRSLRVCKRFDYDKHQSVLQIHIGNVKVNDPTKRFEKLYMAVNGEKCELLCVGSSQGIYYRENIRFDVGDTDQYHLDFLVNEEVLFSEIVQLKECYLFDKWNGTEYDSDNINDSHSGAFVLFSRKQVTEYDEDIEITLSYRSNGFFVYELVTRSKKKSFLIDGRYYSFDRAGKPCMFIKNIDTVDEFVSNIECVELCVMNLNESKSYRIGIENENGKCISSVSEGIFSIAKIEGVEDIKCSGKWDISLWENQRKIDHISFTIVPQISFQQKEHVVLEGKDITLIVSADEKCFMPSVGEFVDSIEVNVGPGFFEEENDTFLVRPIEYYVYIDSISTLKRISFTPKIWGIRGKNANDTQWGKHENLLFNPLKPLGTKCAIVSNGDANLVVNGVEKYFFEGFTEINLPRLLNAITRKTMLIISDMHNTERITIGCLPQYIYNDISMNETVVISFLYAGPINERLRISVFINGFRSISFERDAIKNKFMLHVLIGELKELQGKTVSVEVVGSTGGIPTQIFKQDIPDTNTIPSEEEVQDDKVYENKYQLAAIEDYISVSRLKQYYYSEKNNDNVDIDARSIIGKIGGIIW